ncbi:MAG: hypothetical protein K8R52_01035 [Bacteroidales bacterium]|nr:hypothetical protein [Bacteroidales bacterium]
MGICRFLLVAMIPVALFFSCQRERNFIEDRDARLEFTIDTLFFDTVFTTIGTVTEAFTVKNPHNQFIRIDDIRLAGGAFSVFRINVDGASGKLLPATACMYLWRPPSIPMAQRKFCVYRTPLFSRPMGTFRILTWWHGDRMFI